MWICIFEYEENGVFGGIFYNFLVIFDVFIIIIYESVCIYFKVIIGNSV